MVIDASTRVVGGLVRRQGALAGVVAGILFGAFAWVGAYIALAGSDWQINRIVAVVMIAWIVGFNLGVGTWNPPLGWILGRDPTLGDALASAGAGRGTSRYFRFCTDHKVVGVQYLVLVMTVFAVGGVTAVLMRTQLLTPHSSFLSPNEYNDLVTLHGMCMMIGAVLMVIGPFTNFVLPLMIGARTVALPRLNAMGMWIMVSAVICLFASFVIGGVDTGWSTYAPLADQSSPGMTAFAFTVVGLVACVVIACINTVVTVLTLRARGMTPGRLPIFVWGSLVGSALALATVPAYLLMMTLILTDRTMGTTFFVDPLVLTDGSGVALQFAPHPGGSAWLYEIGFWTMGQPLIYVIFIPPAAALLEVASTFAGRPIFNRRLVVGAFVVTAALSLVSLGHHLYTSGIIAADTKASLVVGELIAVPMGIIVLCLLGTIWRGSIWTRLPMYFVYLFLWDILVGGISGVFLSDPTVDRGFHGGMIVTAHFHFALLGGAMVAATAALCYWFPKMTGRFVDERLGKLAFWMIAIGIQVTFLAQFWVGAQGMARRVAWYEPVYQHANQVASAGAYLLAGGWVVLLWALVWSLRHGAPASADPWQATSLEWKTPTPVPLRNFPVDPVLAPVDVSSQPVLAGAPASSPSAEA